MGSRGAGSGRNGTANLSATEKTWLNDHGATTKQMNSINEVVGNLKKGVTVANNMPVSYENIQISAEGNGKFRITADSFVTQEQRDRKGKVKTVKRPLGGFSHIVGR